MAEVYVRVVRGWGIVVLAGCGRLQFDAGVAPDAAGLSYRDAVLQDAPLAFWRLGDLDMIARDEIDRVEGTYGGGCSQGATGALAGDPDFAVRFDGASCRVDFPDELAFHGRAPFSLELWVSLDTLGGPQPFFFNQTRSGGPLDGFGILNGGEGTYFERSSGGDNRVSARFEPTIGVYTHFVGTYDGTTLTLYANGALVGAPTPMATGLLDSTGARAVIGAYPVGATPAFARALIDEVAVYDYVLPLERIQLHHAIGSLGPQPL